MCSLDRISNLFANKWEGGGLVKAAGAALVNKINEVMTANLGHGT